MTKTTIASVHEEFDKRESLYHDVKGLRTDGDFVYMLLSVDSNHRCKVGRTC